MVAPEMGPLFRADMQGGHSCPPGEDECPSYSSYSAPPAAEFSA